MSVPNQTPYIIYNANGLTTVFPFEFYIISASDIQVTLNGEVVTSGYSVSGVGNIAGGDIIFLTPPANGTVVMLERVVPTYRLTDYQDNGDLLADTVNKDFDRLWMAIQRSFIYLGLALRRPLLGGPFNAEGYRISNLAYPSKPSDATSKKYVDDIYSYLLQTVETAIETIKSGLYGYITKDSFEDGSTISFANECLRWKSNGEYYRWDGTLPKVVPPGSTPESTGGIGKGNWIGVGDASLRADLAKNNGVNYIGSSGIFAYIANGIDDSVGLQIASENAVSRNAQLKIVGVAKVVSPTEVNAQIAYTEKQIFTIDSKITLNGKYALPDWFGHVNGAIDAAINAMPSDGGIIKCLNKRYKPSDYQYGFSSTGKAITKDNISIIGTKMPSPNNTYDRLVNGTVIEGCLLVWANGFYMSDVGVDCGKYVVDTYYAGNPQPGVHEGFFATYQNDAEKNASNYKYGMTLHNISGMAYSSAAMVHAMIVSEGYVNTRCTGVIHAIMGVHGAVFKARDLLIDNVISECSGAEGVIIKSDVQASSRALNIPIKKISCYGAGTQGSNPHSVSPAGAWGVLFQNSGNPIDNVKLGVVDVTGYTNGIGFAGLEEAADI